MKNKKCPFCKLDKQRTRILKENKLFYVVLSNPALVHGHLLIIPKRHVGKFSELNSKELNDLSKLIKKFNQIILKKFKGCDTEIHYRPFQKEDGIKVNHLHIHLKPRGFQDNLYKKCQVYEKSIWYKLSQKELDKIKKELK